MDEFFLLLSTGLNRFCSFPLTVRALIAVLPLLVLCLMFGGVFLFLLSAVPFALKWLFYRLYLVLEWLVAAFHKILGGNFYLASNALSGFGEKITTRLMSWYSAWHKPNRKCIIAMSVFFCAICYVAVIIPSFLSVEDNSWKNCGQVAYLKAESRLTRWFKEQSWYTSVPVFNPVEEQPQDLDQIPQVSMTVIRTNTLRVRDIPSTSGAEILETLKSGDVVLWNGEFTFGIAEGKQEAWVKVITNSGVEGWSRLSFLQAEEVADITFSFAEKMSLQI